MADEEKYGGAASILQRHATSTPPTNIASSVKDDMNVVIIEWPLDDPELPFNWSNRRKYTMVLTACFITALTAINSTSMSIMATWGPSWFGVSRLHFMVGLTMYNLSSSITPLLLAPVSENFGRNEIYQVSSLINAVLFLPQIFSRNISAFLATRWFQGMVSCVGISMVGGTIADLFHAQDRGKCMNIFALIIFIGQALGGLAIGWVGERLGYQWCFGVQGIAAVGSCAINVLLLRETRANTLLSRRAAKLSKATGTTHIARSDLEKTHQSILQQLRVTAIRPLKLLVTEPIVSFLAVWIGFAWGAIFLSGPANMLVFSQYGFSPGELGSVQSCMAIGALLGYFSNFHQERLYKRASGQSLTGRAPPEARLYWAAAGGVMFPAGMMAFAWTGRPTIPWPVPAAMLCLVYWGMYCMYLGVFNYIADAYETYSSSGQAAQSFARNTNSATFPLFAAKMYQNLGYPEASSLVSGLGFVLAAAPFLLLRYGAQLRAKSPITSQLVGNT